MNLLIAVGALGILLIALDLLGFVADMAEVAREWGWQGSALPLDSPHMVRQSKNNR